ncbi:methionyl-tRNA formyltransferase [Flavobacterium terrae]|uniref:Methionyl-tRNA formyltransferase n=1 Tax=Flavobacterium terrae TaxID=415425 RepID=A0A1M6FKU0_9FLAO|nr:formyltransferase family protein [Flavobacterium terrae]SHI98284.1 methionyl-tRNA formyltransferase [Flavobacterium terrae]
MENKKKIVVLCGGKFAFKTLQLLAFEKFLYGIAIGNGNKTVTEALEKEASNSGLAFHSFPTKKSLSTMREWIDEIQPDFIFSISFPFLLPESVLSYGPAKFINFHPGPLPRYRGPMPIFEVLRNQENSTAICAHFMNKNFDEGNIIFNDPIAIEENETYGKLTVKISNRMSQVVLNVANMLEYGSKIPNFVQDENDSCYYEKPELSDTFINWKSMNAHEIVALVNACNPWNTGADASLLGEQIKIISGVLIDELHDNLQEGSIIGMSDDGILKVACSDNEVIGINILSTDEGIMTSKEYFKLKKINQYALN